MDSSAPSDISPFINVTPKVAGRFALAVVLFCAAMHYLVSGRKEASFGKMITGALLALASLACL